MVSHRVRAVVVGCWLDVAVVRPDVWLRRLLRGDGFDRDQCLRRILHVKDVGMDFDYSIFLICGA